MALIRVLIADDHPLMRSALRTIIEDEADLKLIGEVDNGGDAIVQILSLKPDVAIIDLYMPVFDGIEVIRQVMTADAGAHLLVLTSSVEEDMIAEAIQAGALGYLIKDADRPEILEAMRVVSRGHVCFSPLIATKLASSLHGQHALRPASGLESLTTREREILNQIRAGASNPEIARHLRIGETTVRTHIHNILQKLGFETRSQLMMVLLSQQSRKA
jgi:NarL family two-component system response regulator LiaR